jgi:cysteine synthase
MLGLRDGACQGCGRWFVSADLSKRLYNRQPYIVNQELSMHHMRGTIDRAGLVLFSGTAAAAAATATVQRQTSASRRTLLPAPS